MVQNHNYTNTFRYVRRKQSYKAYLYDKNLSQSFSVYWLI